MNNQEILRRVHVGDFQLGEREKRAVIDVLNSGRLSEGEKVREFEREWANFVGSRYCVATSSGTAALITGLTALKYQKDLPPGTEVITTPLTYIADSSAIKVVGFEPVFVDVDPVTFGITPKAIETYLQQTDAQERPAIILAVDLMGFPLDIEGIQRVADEYDLLFFEDAAQAHGSKYNGRVCGSEALLGCFSFYIAHNIQVGEMGALVTSDQEIARLARKIKAQGRACECLVCRRREGKCPALENYQGNDDFDPRFVHDLIGYNFKAMEFQAALALTQLKKVDEIIKVRQENVMFLNKHLERYSGILQLPPFSTQVSYLAYPLVIRDSEVITRRKLRQQLESQGVETRPLFGCIPTQQPAFVYLKEQYQGRLPHAEHIGRDGFYIGCHQYLTEQDLDYVVSAFERILG